MTVQELRDFLDQYPASTDVKVACLETYEGVSIWRIADVAEIYDEVGAIVIYPEEE